MQFQADVKLHIVLLKKKDLKKTNILLLWEINGILKYFL